MNPPHNDISKGQSRCQSQPGRDFRRQLIWKSLREASIRGIDGAEDPVMAREQLLTDGH
jgi:hypothetical protein